MTHPIADPAMQPPESFEQLDARLHGLWVPADTPTFWVHLRPDSVSGREIDTAGSG